MALHHLTTPSWQARILAALPARNRLAALSGANPALADAVARLGEGRYVRKLTVETAVEALGYVENLDTLTHVLDIDPRDSVQQACEMRIIRLANPEIEEPLPPTMVEHTTKIIDNMLETKRIPGLSRSERIDWGLFLDRYKEADNYGRFLMACLCSQSGAPGVLGAQISADVASGALVIEDTMVRQYSLYKLVLAHWDGPYNSVLADWLVRIEDRVRPAPEMFGGLAVDASAAEVFKRAGRYDLLYLSGAAPDEVVNHALRSPRASQLALASVVSDADFDTVVLPLLRTFIAKAEPTEWEAWSYLSETRLRNINPLSRETVRLLMRVAPADTFADAVTASEMSWSSEELDEIILEVAENQTITTGAKLLVSLQRRASTREDLELFERIFQNCRGIRVIDGWRSRAGNAYFGRYIGDRLGGHGDKWSVFFALAPSFTGSVNELLDAIDAITTPGNLTRGGADGLMNTPTGAGERDGVAPDIDAGDALVTA